MYITNDRTPYTYLIGWSRHDRWYYGVRHGKGCHPSDLWIKYRTSSKHVQSFADKYGDPDVIQIRKIFETSHQAIAWENKVLNKLNVVYDDKWLNRTNNKSIHHDDCAWMRGKSYEELFGEVKGKQLREKRSLSNSTRTRVPWNEDAKHHKSNNSKNHLNVKAKPTSILVNNETKTFLCRKYAIEYIADISGFTYNEVENAFNTKQRGQTPRVKRLFPLHKLFNLTSSMKLN